MSTALAPIPAFPGRVVKAGHSDQAIVLAIQHQLNELGCGPLEEDGDFGKNTKSAVKLFQARFTDTDGLPLKIDGEVGAITWAALFGAQSVPVSNNAESPLLARVLEVAATQVGVMEEPLGSNRGPRVDEYVRSVGLNPEGKHAWCVTFTYWCFAQATQALDRKNPMIKTGGVLKHWNDAGKQGIPRITTTRAVNNPALVKPGHVFVIDTGQGLGHSGFVERVVGGKLMTIEGNTNEGGSRNGIGVFRRAARKIVSINKGFIDYSNL